MYSRLLALTPTIRVRWRLTVLGIIIFTWALRNTCLAADTPAITGDSNASDTIPEVIVTAQRRGERNEDVPISINVQSAASLEQAGITNIRDLTLVVPGLNFTAQGNNAQPTLRGVSTDIATAGSESNVAIYLDDVYQPAEAGNLFDLPDVSNVEVLKGPQGTLFGRNATVGALLRQTRDPSNIPEGKISLSAGQFDTRGQEYQTKAFYTGPISDTLAYSVAGSYINNTGYFHDVLRDESGGQIRSEVFRAKLLWQPSDSVKIEPTVFYTYTDDYAAESYLQTHPLAAALGGVLATEPWQIAEDTRGYAVTSNYGSSLKAEFEIPLGTLKSVTSFSKIDEFNVTDEDATALTHLIYWLRTPTQSDSEEITFASHQLGPARFITGVYYFHDSMELSPLGVGPTVGVFPVILDTNETSTSLAWFGQGSFQLLDKLSADAGIRYSYERRATYAATVVEDPLPERGQASFDKWTPRFSLRYQITPDSNVYATYSEGFKSGFFDTTTFSPNPIKPEDAKSYEVGYKTAMSHFDFSAAVFRMDVQNLQVQEQMANGLSITANAATARVQGVEFDASWRATQAFTTRLEVSWLPTAKYTSYPNATVVVPVPYSSGGGGTNEVENLSGTRLEKAPTWQTTLLLNYTKPFEWGTIDASTNISFLSHYNYDLAGYLEQAGYPKINATIHWTPASFSKLRVGAFVKNITNRAIIESYQAPLAVNYMAPREVGISADVSF